VPDACDAREPDRDRTGKRSDMVAVVIAPALGPMSAVTRDLLEERRRLLAEVHRLRENNDDLRDRLAYAHREIEHLRTRLLALIDPPRVAAAK
jgi:hypothetical protein